MSTTLFTCDDTIWKSHLMTNERKRAVVNRITEELCRKGLSARVEESPSEFGPKLHIFVGNVRLRVEVRGLNKLYVRPHGLGSKKEFGEFRNGEFNWRAIIDAL